MGHKFRLLLLTSLILTGLILAKPAGATETAADSAIPKTRIFSPDGRVIVLKEFLESYQSPLADYVDFFVQIADKYEIDWKLVPAITGVESTFGKHIPYNSFNAYGWNNGNYHFSSWEESIEKVSSVLKEKYIDLGLDTPAKIGRVYAPPSSTWAGNLVYFMNRIEDFHLTFPNLTI